VSPKAGCHFGYPTSHVQKPIWTLPSPTTRVYSQNAVRVGEVENGRGFFAAGGQTKRFLKFKFDSICLPMFKNCGLSSIRSCRLLPHVKLSCTNPEIGTRHVKSSSNRLLVKPLSTGPLTDSHGNPRLNPCCLLNSFTD